MWPSRVLLSLEAGELKLWQACLHALIFWLLHCHRGLFSLTELDESSLCHCFQGAPITSQLCFSQLRLWFLCDNTHRQVIRFLRNNILYEQQSLLLASSQDCTSCDNSQEEKAWWSLVIRLMDNSTNSNVSNLAISSVPNRKLSLWQSGEAAMRKKTLFIQFTVEKRTWH